MIAITNISFHRLNLRIQLVAPMFIRQAVIGKLCTMYVCKTLPSPTPGYSLAYLTAFSWSKAQYMGTTTILSIIATVYNI